LIGSVPGCDLRLPGTNLPPVIGLIARHARGVSFRKLVPAQQVLVNGRPTTGELLSHGDRVNVGSVELLVHVEALPGVPAEEPLGGVYFAPIPPPSHFPPESAGLPGQAPFTTPAADLAARAAELEEIRKELAQSRQQLYAQYRERRDRLSGLQEALRRA